MADHHDPKPAAAAPSGGTVTETVKAAVTEAAGKAGGGIVDHLVKLAKEFGVDTLFHLFGAPVVDRVIGHNKLEEARKHAEAGNFEEAWETIHGHINEHRPRYGKAELRIRRQRFGVTDVQFDSYDRWFAALLPHQQAQIKRHFESYANGDDQVQNLVTFIRMTDAQRSAFLARIHEPGLMDAMRANHAAVRASNARLDTENTAIQARIRNVTGQSAWHGFFTRW